MTICLKPSRCAPHRAANIATSQQASRSATPHRASPRTSTCGRGRLCRRSRQRHRRPRIHDRRGWPASRAAGISHPLGGDGTEGDKSDIRPIVAVDNPDAIARAEEWLRTAPEAVEGAGGDDLTFRTACRVFDFGLSPDAAWDAMLDHWNDRCSPPWDPEDLRAKVDNAARYRSSPIGIASPEAEFGVVLDADEIEAKASWRSGPAPRNAPIMPGVTPPMLFGVCSLARGSMATSFRGNM